MYGGGAELKLATGPRSSFQVARLLPAVRRSSTRSSQRSAGRTRASAGGSSNDYRVVDIVARLSTGGQVPLLLVADYCWNTAMSSGNRGLWLAAVIGSTEVSRAPSRVHLRQGRPRRDRGRLQRRTTSSGAPAGRATARTSRPRRRRTAASTRSRSGSGSRTAPTRSRARRGSSATGSRCARPSRAGCLRASSAAREPAAGLRSPAAPAGAARLRRPTAARRSARTGCGPRRAPGWPRSRR